MNNFPIDSLPIHSASPTLAINEAVQRRWERGQNVYHLAFGESRMPLHPRLVEAHRRNVEQKSYLECTGLYELREKVAAFHQTRWNLPVDANQVIVGPGSKSLLFAIILGLDCHVLLPTPSWVSYAPQAELAGRQYTYLESCFDDDYEITIASIEKALQQPTSGQIPLLILNSPNNPSGKALSESKLQEIAKYCRTRQILVVSDEIYALVTYGDQPHRSIATYYPEGTIIVGGPSKHLSLGGWRLGTAVTPSSLIGQVTNRVLRTIASEVWSSPTSAIQHAATVAYSDDPAIVGYIETCTELHELKTVFLMNSFKRLGVRCTVPEGGFYFLANFDKFRGTLEHLGVNTSVELADYLLQNYEIATLPGSVFGIRDRELSLRIASSYIDMETDEKAQHLMSTFLSNERSLKQTDLENSLMAVERLQSFMNLIDKD